jgi:hypothetical protein
MSQTFMSPEAPARQRSNNNLTQAETAASWFHSLSPQNRVFAVFAAGDVVRRHAAPDPAVHGRLSVPARCLCRG